MAAILVVDDSTVMRKLLRDALGECQSCVVQTVPDGLIALAAIKQSMPDLIILDIEMPGIDGLETLNRIRQIDSAVPVVMFSALTEQGTSATIEALMRGATDYATKPLNSNGVSAALEAIRNQLLPKIRALIDTPSASATQHVPPPGAKPRGGERSPKARLPVEIVAIGSSTGGPNVLAEIVPRFARETPVPIVIVQHMPPVFTRFLAERLDAVSNLEVREAQGGERLTAGSVWIAPGDLHMIVRRDHSGSWIETQQGKQENSCRPSVDVLFRSVNAAYPGAALGVVLTGMGQDGFSGAQLLAASGSAILAQDEASSVVWGMPGYVTRAGIAEKILPPLELAEEICSRLHLRPSLRSQSKGEAVFS